MRPSQARSFAPTAPAKPRPPRRLLSECSACLHVYRCRVIAPGPRGVWLCWLCCLGSHSPSVKAKTMCSHRWGLCTPSLPDEDAPAAIISAMASTTEYKGGAVNSGSPLSPTSAPRCLTEAFQLPTAAPDKLGFIGFDGAQRGARFLPTPTPTI